MSDFEERQSGALTIKIDRSTCIASANCMVVSPDAFEFDNDSICAFAAGVDTVDRETLIEACKICPVEALIVLDENGNKIVPG